MCTFKSLALAPLAQPVRFVVFSSGGIAMVTSSAGTGYHGYKVKVSLARNFLPGVFTQEDIYNLYFSVTWLLYLFCFVNIVQLTSSGLIQHKCGFALFGFIQPINPCIPNHQSPITTFI